MKNVMSVMVSYALCIACN